MQYKRTFLVLLIVSVVISALLGIGIILFGDFGEFELKILGTSNVITAMSLLGLACGASYEAGALKRISAAGMFFSVVSGIIWIVLIWANGSEGEYYIKTAFTTTIFAISFTYASLLALARLDKRFRWIRTAGYIVVATLVCVLLYVIWINNEPNEEIIGRIIGSLSILIGAFTVIVPVLHKLSGKGEFEAQRIDSEIEALKSRLSELELRKSELESEAEPEEVKN